MANKEMKTLNGYEVVDAQARADISDIPSKYALKTDIPDVSDFQTAEQVTQLINTAIGDIENGTY